MFKTMNAYVNIKCFNTKNQSCYTVKNGKSILSNINMQQC